MAAGTFEEEFLKHVSEMNVTQAVFSENVGNSRVDSELGAKPTGNGLPAHSPVNMARWERTHNGERVRKPLDIARTSKADKAFETILGVVLILGFIAGIGMIIFGALLK